MTGAISFAWDILYGRIKSNTQRELSQNLRLASKRIAYEIRNASGITTVTSNSITLAFASDPSRNPTIINLDNGRVGIRYGVSGPCTTTLLTPCFLTSNLLTISGLTFTNLSSGSSNNIRVVINGVMTGSRSEYKANELYTTSAELRK